MTIAQKPDFHGRDATLAQIPHWQREIFAQSHRSAFATDFR